MENIPLSPSGRRSRFASCCPAQENDGLRIILFCFGVLCICVTIALIISINLGEPEVPPQGAVATDSQLCSQIGVDVLKKLGGNAVDAAVASTLCMCVVNPHIVSLGGGGAMIVLDHLGSKTGPTVINFQDAAPAAYSNNSLVGIPGLLSGLWESHNKFGRLEWSALVQPAIDLCVDGIAVSSQLAFATQSLPADSPVRRSSSLFFPKGIALAEGQIIKQIELAELLKVIAKDGVGEFYGGLPATKLVNFMKKSGADWSLDDLKKYQARIEPAISGVYGHTKLYTSSAPTSGPQLISLLNIMSGLLEPVQDHEQFTLHYFHRLIESMRLTQNQITKLGDPVFDAEVNETISLLLNKTLSDQVGKQILPDRILPDSNDPILPEGSSSVVTVIDNGDLYVSLVAGLNTMFGSQLELPEYGFLLNNALANFYPENSPNSFKSPGQRPLQGMTPVIGVDANGKCGMRFVAGAPDATLLGQVVMNLVPFNESAFEAVAAARVKTQAQSHSLTLEDTVQRKLPENVIADLIKMGHFVTPAKAPYPSINVVLKNGDSLSSESDGRGGGHSVKFGSST